MAEDSAIGTPAESPLAPAILRGLGDRSYEKRKNAALEIEALIKTLEDNNETDRICSIIVLLGQDFATSTNAHHRKGGLIGLAATAIGLMSVGVVRRSKACSFQEPYINHLLFFLGLFYALSTYDMDVETHLTSPVSPDMPSPAAGASSYSSYYTIN